MGTRKRHNPYKKVAPQKDELITFLTQVLHSEQRKLRRPMTRQEIEEILERAVQRFVDWLEEQNQPNVSTSASSSLTLKDIAERETFRREHRRLIVDISTWLWRLRKELVNPETGQPIEETRRAYRHFQSVWDVLQEAGYTIQDHTGQPVKPHQKLKVITYEPKPGIEREIISETIKPSVYYQSDETKEMIQMGEVIVAIPTAMRETPPIS
jgi:hypothetical protein